MKSALLKESTIARWLLLGSTFVAALSACSLSQTPPMPSDDQAYYFGRYTFTAPTDGSGIWSAYDVIGERIELISHDGRQDIDKHLDERIAGLKKMQKFGYAAYDQTIRLDGGGAIVVSKDRYYDFDIFYLTDKNMLYRQKVDMIDLPSLNKATSLAREVNSYIHFRSLSDPPPTNTFAIENGYMKLPIDKFNEQVSIGLPVTSIPGIHLTFDTRVIGRPEPGLIARYEQRTSGFVMPLLMKLITRSTVLRKTRKEVAGLMFDELLIRSRAEGKNVYAFRLEYPGTPDSSLEPYTVLELSTVDSGPGFMNDAQALQFWDRLTSSLRRL
ncbi:MULTISPECIES: T6SS immunity protein Tli4 family protein [unclassified Pseudomonas]|uniref:T6SS immunity protein Tli4 family protein n=1 Tax=unclassified Pseudomonas TaxID=196821 RepID=UPI00117A901D|nr:MULTISPECIES: T6SS immunity protein Tli4 family protein [unclassified Pseudomonas]